MGTGYTLYSMQDSGNCYKVRLILHRLGLPFRLVETDSMSGATRTAEFLALNPNGKVPLLVLPDGRRLAESNAMLLHLAEDSRYVPRDSYDRAICYQWLFFEQYSHEPYIAVARSWMHLIEGGRDKAKDRFPDLHRKGYAALGVMEERLSAHDWLAGDAYSVADIALYAYTHVAHQGGFDLGPYPGLRAWLDRFAAEPRHVDLTWKPDPLA